MTDSRATDADAARPAVPDPVDPAFYARHLDAISALQRVKGYKRRTLELLAVAEGHRVLDVGCDVGDEVRALAQLVGARGQAVGIDASAAMVAEARRRAEAEGSAAFFETADAARLPFPEDHFDGCQADRLMQHLRQPAGAVAELARVVRRDGRVILAEPDWETYIVDAPDRAITRRILNARCDGFPEGWAGRQLPRLLRAAGLDVEAVHPLTAVYTRFAEADTVGILRGSASRAVRDGVVSAAEADAWVAALERADRAGDFFASGTLFVVAARRR